MQYDWVLIICIEGGICDHRELKSTICPTHLIFCSCHIFPQALLELGTSCKMNQLYFISVSLSSLPICWSYQSVKKYLEQEKPKKSIWFPNKVIECFLSNPSSYIQQSEKMGIQTYGSYRCSTLVKIKIFVAKKKQCHVIEAVTNWIIFS